MPLEPLVCIVCVAMVDAQSPEADGWVFVRHSIDEGDDHSDGQWKCPLHASASDEFFADEIAEDEGELGA